MKLLRKGSMLLDYLDIVYLSLFFGSFIFYLNQRKAKK
jgi:hypothetical protein